MRFLESRAATGELGMYAPGAAALGLTVPQSLLAIPDKVVDFRNAVIYGGKAPLGPTGAAIEGPAARPG
jgi:hypothetical protein